MKYLFLLGVALASFQGLAQITDANYRIYSVKLQKEVGPDEIIKVMEQADVLFYGEEHNDSVTHYLEQKIFGMMEDQYKEKLCLSMEMFEKDVQPVMNEYLQGFVREKTFLKDARVWRNYRDYKPLVELAKEKKLEVVCANAPGRYSSLAGRSGQQELLRLPPVSKAWFAPLPYDTATGAYYEKLMKESGHTGKKDTVLSKAPPMMGNFNLVQAQSLWDATMAWSVAECLKKNKGYKVMQVNGRFHSDEGFAVVTQLKKYAPQARTVIISAGREDSFSKPDWDKFKKLGDFVIITDPKVGPTYPE
ncbi:MAG TPA: ChaN family lipoprotein [Bacteroidia bacterium]|jgi:uncharacterized iron-regulated protein|nr:ChaN family lipoprotein [Bacteroidia bacterium]